MTVEIITSSVSWLCPPGVTSVDAECVGAGQDGQSDSLSPQGVSGGRGGDYAKKLAIAVTPGASYTVSVGTSSSLDSYFVNTSTVLGKGGGSSSTTTGDVTHTGGVGYTPAFFENFGGGGGGGAGSGGNGATATNQTGGAGAATYGGSGGNGGNNASNGAVGSNYGGGGGGAGAGTNSGGLAAPGVVVLTYTQPDFPKTHQASQRFDPLPNLNFVEHEQFRRQPVPLTYLETGVKLPRSAYDPSIYEKIHHEQTVYNQLRKQPIPITPPASSGLTNPKKSQRHDPLPVIYYDYQRRQLKPITYTTFNVSLLGNYRIANDIAGFVLYIGTNAPPTFDGTPQAYSATLPVSYTITPPGTFHVVLRKRDEYGLESQNRYARLIAVDAGGNEIYADIPLPLNVRAYPLKDGKIRVLAKYATYGLDAHSANKWRVWISPLAINPITDPPHVEVNSSASLRSDSTGFTPGLYNVVVGLYRIADTALTYVATTVTIPEIPDQPVGVYSGYDFPNI